MDSINKDPIIEVIDYRAAKVLLIELQLGYPNSVIHEYLNMGYGFSRKVTLKNGSFYILSKSDPDEYIKYMACSLDLNMVTDVEYMKFLLRDTRS